MLKPLQYWRTLLYIGKPGDKNIRSETAALKPEQVHPAPLNQLGLTQLR